MATKNNVSLSTGKSVPVCGGAVIIKKMPVGAYLKAMERLNGLSADFIEKVFPGKNIMEIFDNLSNIDNEGLTSLITGLLVSAPSYVVSIIAELTETDADKLMNDPAIGLDGLIEIVNAFIEVNSLGKFILEAKGLTMKITGLKTTNTGSSN